MPVLNLAEANRSEFDFLSGAEGSITLLTDVVVFVEAESLRRASLYKISSTLDTLFQT